MSDENKTPDSGNENSAVSGEEFRNRIREILQRGDAVREEVGDAVGRAAASARGAGNGMAEISKTVMSEAASAAGERIDDPAGEGVLRDVIDGLGDGFSATAQAARLAMDEAKSSGRKFADEDLKSIAGEFQGLGELLVGSVGEAMRTVGGHLAGQADSVREHARNTLERVRPALEDAAGTARGQVGELGREAAGAGAAAARQATGVLFAELGALLQKAGGRIQSGASSDRAAQDSSEVPPDAGNP